MQPANAAAEAAWYAERNVEQAANRDELVRTPSESPQAEHSSSDDGGGRTGPDYSHEASSTVGRFALIDLLTGASERPLPGEDDDQAREVVGAASSVKLEVQEDDSQASELVVSPYLKFDVVEDDSQACEVVGMASSVKLEVQPDDSQAREVGVASSVKVEVQPDDSQPREVVGLPSSVRVGVQRDDSQAREVVAAASSVKIEVQPDDSQACEVVAVASSVKVEAQGSPDDGFMDVAEIVSSAEVTMAMAESERQPRKKQKLK